MRRTEYLQNPKYKTKYRELYKLIFTADIDDISDFSNWLRSSEEQDIITLRKPLEIDMVVSKINKRMWIRHEFGEFKISTAQLDLNVDSKEYHESYQRYSFSTQRDLCSKLKEILEPCLELKKEEIEKDIVDDMY